MFINVIHATGEPAFFIGSQWKVKHQLFLCLSRSLKIEIDINIIETVFIIMPDDEIGLIDGGSILNGKGEGRGEAVFPTMPGHGSGFFIQVRGGTGKKDTRTKQDEKRYPE